MQFATSPPSPAGALFSSTEIPGERSDQQTDLTPVDVDQRHCPETRFFDARQPKGAVESPSTSAGRGAAGNTRMTADNRGLAGGAPGVSGDLDDLYVFN